eukprot:scaffold1051_cov254-Pinguiococcus_pyrenoidosus.AAC.2
MPQPATPCPNSPADFSLLASVALMPFGCLPASRPVLWVATRSLSSSYRSESAWFQAAAPRRRPERRISPSLFQAPCKPIFLQSFFREDQEGSLLRPSNKGAATASRTYLALAIPRRPSRRHRSLPKDWTIWMPSLSADWEVMWNMRELPEPNKLERHPETHQEAALRLARSSTAVLQQKPCSPLHRTILPGVAHANRQGETALKGGAPGGLHPVQALDRNKPSHQTRAQPPRTRVPPGSPSRFPGVAQAFPLVWGTAALAVRAVLAMLAVLAVREVLQSLNGLDRCCRGWLAPTVLRIRDRRRLPYQDRIHAG